MVTGITGGVIIHERLNDFISVRAFVKVERVRRSRRRVRGPSRADDGRRYRGAYRSRGVRYEGGVRERTKRRRTPLCGIFNNPFFGITDGSSSSSSWCGERSDGCSARCVDRFTARSNRCCGSRRWFRCDGRGRVQLRKSERTSER